MIYSERLAIAAHLHVLLRRKSGRVTDTEWMASNTDYAAEIVRFARNQAIEEGHTDLAGWAEKLELAMVNVEGLHAHDLSFNAMQPPEVLLSLDAQEACVNRYIGRLR